MAEDQTNKYEDKKSISAQSVTWFLEMLDKEGLRKQFLDQAPKSKTTAASELLLNSDVFAGKSQIDPQALAHGMDRLSTVDTAISTDVLQASLSVEPELMEFARTFVMNNNLTANYSIAKGLKKRKCGNGREVCKGR